MLRFLLCCAAVAFLAGPNADGARILSIFPFPGKSHFISFSPLLEELAKRGHEVTVVSAFPRKSPLKNYKDITIEDFLNKGGAPTMNFFENHNANIFAFMLIMRSLSVELCEFFLNEPGVQALIHSTEEHFDLIIYEPFFSECTYGLIHKFQAPFIQISSNVIAKWMGDGVGNPFFYSYFPEVMLDYSDKMTFTERVINTLTNTFFDLERQWNTLPKMEALMRKYFPDPNIPSIPEIEANTSFLFTNSHVSINYPRPLTPNTAEVGGMHLKEAKNLPQDLQKILDDAKGGVIYFSLGSNIRSIDMPESTRQNFLTVFSKLKQKVLWKWEADSLPGQPKNVHLSKWFPQSDILGHPNVRLFITHGGLLSTQEATYFGVPLLAIPFWADQKQNALKAVDRGYAVYLDVQNLTEKALDWSLNKLLTESRYRERATHLSNIFRDQSETPLQRAVFWTEYVIRHRGAPHMRSAALNLNFLQYFLLDVIAVILLVSIVFLIVSVKISKLICRSIFCKSKPPKNTTRQKKTN